jgi:hypothetical protein
MLTVATILLLVCVESGGVERRGKVGDLVKSARDAEDDLSPRCVVAGVGGGGRFT